MLLGSQAWKKCDVSRLYTKCEKQVKCNTSIHHAIKYSKCNSILCFRNIFAYDIFTVEPQEFIAVNVAASRCQEPALIVMTGDQNRNFEQCVLIASDGYKCNFRCRCDFDCNAKTVTVDTGAVLESDIIICEISISLLWY